MKKTRIFALLCALVLILGSLSFASAETKGAMHTKGTEQSTSKRIGYESERYYLLKNGKSITFYVMPNYMGSLLPKSTSKSLELWYDDIMFDCEGPLKAKCSASWVHINNDTPNEFTMYWEPNKSYKHRTATITVTGKNYKAKFKLIQFGASKIAKVVRKGNKVSVQIKLAKKAVVSSKINLEWYKSNEDESTTYKYMGEYDVKPGKTFKFKVKKGYNYSLGLYTEYKVNKNHNHFFTADSLYFAVNDTTGEQVIK